MVILQKILKSKQDSAFEDFDAVLTGLKHLPN